MAKLDETLKSILEDLCNPFDYADKPGWAELQIRIAIKKIKKAFKNYGYENKKR